MLRPVIPAPRMRMCLFSWLGMAVAMLIAVRCVDGFEIQVGVEALATYLFIEGAGSNGNKRIIDAEASVVRMAKRLRSPRMG